MSESSEPSYLEERTRGMQVYLCVGHTADIVMIGVERGGVGRGKGGGDFFSKKK